MYYHRLGQELLLKTQMKKSFGFLFTVVLLCFFYISLIESIASDPVALKNLYLQSYNYEKTSNYKDAIRTLLSVYKSESDSYIINLRLGWLYYLEGRYANSISFYKKASKIAPEAIEPLLGISLPLIAQGHFNEVETLMYEVIKKDFYNYFGNLRLAIALRHQRKYGQAQKVIEKMLRLYPSDINFLLELGLVEKSRGNVKRAKDIFKRVLLLDPLNRVAKYSLSSLEKGQQK